jgi:hypothetical protein
MKGSSLAGVIAIRRIRVSRGVDELVCVCIDFELVLVKIGYSAGVGFGVVLVVVDLPVGVSPPSPSPLLSPSLSKQILGQQRTMPALLITQ